jgi:lipopolysaccharide export system permease protein
VNPFFGQINRFVLTSILVPFLGTMAVAIFLLTTDQMLRLFNFVVNENGPISLVFMMLGNLMPEYIALSLPISFFIGILIAFRRLSLNSELEVITGNGVSLRNLLPPILLCGTFLAVADVYIEGTVKPQSLYRYQQLGFEAQQHVFSSTLRPGEFLSLSDRKVLRFASLDKAGRVGKKVFFRNCEQDKPCTVITAKDGVFTPAADKSHLTLHMKNGRQLVHFLDDEKPMFLNFDRLDIDILMPAIPAFRARADKGEEATNGELLKVLRGPDARQNQHYYNYRANLHGRIINALSFFALPFLAISFGLTSKRRNAYGGIILGIGSLILYLEVIQSATLWAKESTLSPWLSMWPVFIVFFVSSLSLFFYVSERPGAQVLAPVRRLLFDGASAIQAYFGLRRRRRI